MRTMAKRYVYGVLSLLLAVWAGTEALSQEAERKATVFFKADEMTPVKRGDSTVVRLVDHVVFFHNGAVIECDTAYRYSDKLMEGTGRVLINKDSTYIYGDRFIYDGETNVARVFAPIIKMVDKDAVLYTFNLEFNTETNVGKYYGGGTLRQKDNLMESQEGMYYAQPRDVVFVGDVSMENDNYKIHTDSVGFNMNTEVVTFFSKAYIWNVNDEFLMADRGHYYRNRDVYDFTRNAYVLTREQELWADSLVYDSRNEEAQLNMNIQILDTVQMAYSFGDWGHYWGGDRLRTGRHKRILLTQDPSVIAYEPEGDSTYMRADTLLIYSLPRPMALREMEERRKQEEALDGEYYYEDDSLAMAETAGPPLGPVDSLAPSPLTEETAPFSDEDRVEAEQAAEKDARKAEKEDKKAARERKEALREERRRLKKEKRERTGKVSEERIRIEERAGEAEVKIVEKVETDTVAASPLPPDPRLVPDYPLGETVPPDEVVPAAPLLPQGKAKAGTALLYGPDSLAGTGLPVYGGAVPGAGADSVQNDSSAYIIHAYYHVRIFRPGMQSVCDSLVSYSVDSTAHLFGEPVAWSDSSQLTARKIVIHTANQQLDRAVCTGRPIIGQLVDLDSSMYNQITGKEIIGYFRNNEMYLADVNGNAQTYYYMEDEGEVQAFMSSTCGKMEIYLEERRISRIVWLEQPVYNIYPLDKIPADQPTRLEGFSWQEDRRPKDRREVFDRTIRPSYRAEAEAIPRPVFGITREIDRLKEEYIREGVWYDRSEPVTADLSGFVSSASSL